MMVVASEAGVISFEPETIKEKDASSRERYCLSIPRKAKSITTGN